MKLSRKNEALVIRFNNPNSLSLAVIAKDDTVTKAVDRNDTNNHNS